MKKTIEEIKQEVNYESLCDYLGIDRNKDINKQIETIYALMDEMFEKDYILKNMDRDDGYIYQNSIIHICNLIMFYTYGVTGDFNEEEMLRLAYPLGYYFEMNIETDSDTRPLKDYLGYKYKFRYYFNYLRNIQLIEEPKDREDFVINGLIYQRKGKFDLAEEMYKKANADEALRNLEYVKRTNYPDPKYLNHNDMNYYIIFNKNDSEVLYQLGVEYYYGMGRERKKELGLSYLNQAAKKGNKKAIEKLEEIKHK